MASKSRHAFKLKADLHSESKDLVLEINWVGCSEDATQAIATRQIIVDVQGQLRKRWADLEPGEVVTVNAIAHVPKGGDVLSLLKNMKPEDRKKFLEENGLL